MNPVKFTVGYSIIKLMKIKTKNLKKLVRVKQHLTYRENTIIKTTVEIKAYEDSHKNATADCHAGLSHYPI